ncbi:MULTISPECIES: hypothetical protein [Anaerotruncus]|jgi:hypothetical protein|uniref:hypothetical protein n=1 Tax=Anaerotruncus TaxID=244127 RepID=UPI000832C322|nr:MULTISPECIES: hypothetical protein [Anaerotruncus]RGX55671.1 hypothetical protein DWV16_07900 [Anaerotruncus sp. AF02-27]
MKSENHEPYFLLFSRVTDSINVLNALLDMPDIPSEALRVLGVEVENLKKAQADAEECFIAQ